MAGQDSIKLPDFGAVEKSHMYVLTTWLHVLCPHTDGNLLKIKKKEGWWFLIQEIFEWFMTLHEKLILVRLLKKKTPPKKNKKKKNLNYPLPERGFSGTMKQTGRNKYFKYNITWLRIPAGRRRTSWLFTSEAEELNLGLPRNNYR